MAAQQLSTHSASSTNDNNTLSVVDGAGDAGSPISFCPTEFGAQLEAATLALLHAQWVRLAEEWLILKRSKSNSPHTLRTYRTAFARWRNFLASQERPVEVWEAGGAQVRAWQAALRAQGLAESTVNHHLAAVSSFYTFALHEPGSGLSVNPCKGNVLRGRVRPYAGVRVLTVEEYGQLLGWLEANTGTVAGARAHALLVTYLHTGWRSAELLRMQWGDLRPHRTQRGAYVYAWRGKGGRRQDDVLPADAAAAMVHYLQRAGRWQPAADAYVWQRMATPNMVGLRNGGTGATDGPISATTALRILRAALAEAGIDQPARFRIHDLRHTHAHLLLRAGHNLATVQARLHHSSLATTGIYARTVFRDDPEDVFSEDFRRLRR